MRRFLVSISLAAIGFALWPIDGALAAGTVTGSVTTNGQKVPLVVTYVDESPDDIIIVLASKTLPADVVPFIGEEVARKLKVHAVAFTVSRATRTIARTFGGVFYPGPEMGFVGLAEGVATLQVKRMDAKGIEARIFTPKPVKLSDITYSFDATFSVPLASAAPPSPAVTVKISGDTSAPALAYAEYYRAGFAGDVEKIRMAFVADRRKDFDTGDPQKRGMLLDLLKSNPAEIRIGKPTITGATATLTVEGLNETASRTTATVTMVNEAGAWKVGKEKWSSTSK